VNESGAFGLNFTEPGVYRINVNPSGSLTGFSRGTAYVRVEVGGDDVLLCSQSAAEVAAGSACGLTSSEITGAQIALPGANLVGTVSGPSGTLRDAWVELMQESSFGQRWIEGSPTNGSGAFSLTVTEAGAYTLQVNPPWNNTSGLTSKRIPIVAGAFGVRYVLTRRRVTGDLTGYRKRRRLGDQCCR
jgi:hypothetical protein